MNASGGSVPGRNGGSRRATSPAGCSTFTTSAPKSASRQPHIGPAQVVVASSTRTPASGPGRSRRASRKNSAFSMRISPRPPVLQRGRLFHREAAMDSGFQLGPLLINPWHASAALLLGRVAIGVCFVIHGLGKLGLVGTGSMQGFVEFLDSIGVPMAPMQARMAMLSEITGGSLLALGLFTRPACLLLIFTMIVAARIGHKGAGYLITNNPPGAEYTINLAAICAVFFLTGPGAISLDYLLFR